MGSDTAKPVKGAKGGRAVQRKDALVIGAASVGTVFEWYDFYLYGSLATFITQHFFSGVNETTGYIFALLAFAAGFAVRPFGALVFGRLGDLWGRKNTFLVTMMLMGLSTFVVGLLPSYAAIGIAAPILLVTLRVAQGFSVGGEAACAMTFLAEHAPDGHRGRITSYAQIASFVALLTGTLVAYAMSPWLSAAAIEGGGFGSFAWRIPFLVAIPMGVIGFYIRKHIADTPNFTRLKESGGLSHNPLREAFATPEHRRAMLLALFIPLMNGSGYYVLFSYMPTFLKSQQIGFDTGTALLVTAASLVVISIAIPIMGKLSDRVGRKRVIAGAAIAMAIAGVPCYALIVTGNVALAILGACLMAFIFAGHTAVIHILIVELFPTRVRYSAYGLGYNISSALFGGTAPLLMTLLIPQFGIYVPAWYAVITALGTLAAVSTVKDRAHLPLRDTL